MIAQFSLSDFVLIIFMFCGLGSRVLLFLQTQRNPQYLYKVYTVLKFLNLGEGVKGII